MVMSLMTCFQIEKASGSSQPGSSWEKVRPTRRLTVNWEVEAREARAREARGKRARSAARRTGEKKERLALPARLNSTRGCRRGTHDDHFGRAARLFPFCDDRCCSTRVLKLLQRRRGRRRPLACRRRRTMRVVRVIMFSFHALVRWTTLGGFTCRRSADHGRVELYRHHDASLHSRCPRQPEEGPQ